MYSYDYRSVLAKESPAELARYLDVFKRMLDVFEKSASKDLSPYASKMFLEKGYQQVAGIVGSMFRGILATYQLDAKDRKVMEKAAVAFSKSRIVVRRGKEVETYAKTMKTWRLYYNTAEKALENGAVHEAGSWKAGPFDLVNTGGFGDKAMQDVIKVVEKSTMLLKQHGLGKICYGDINVTNTIQRSTRTLAFYMIGKDELYIRANLKGKQGPAVRSVTHELGHRLYYKYLKSKKQEIDQIYRILSKQERDRVRELLDDKTKWPQKGEEHKEGRKTYVVDWVQYPNVILHRKDDINITAKYPLKSWLQNVTPESVSSFVTPYAATDASENFAEMIAYYCEGLLPDDQVNMLKGVL